jgi:hypothetical protein
LGKGEKIVLTTQLHHAHETPAFHARKRTLQAVRVLVQSFRKKNEYTTDLIHLLN